MKDYKKYIITQGDKEGLSWTDIEEYLLTPSEYKRFVKWMIGQTCGMIGPYTVVYPEDYERFIKGLPVID